MDDTVLVDANSITNEEKRAAEVVTSLLDCCRLRVGNNPNECVPDALNSFLQM
jgi:hypothetical protein